MAVRAVVVGSLVMDLSFLVPKRPEPGEVVTATGFGQYRGGKGYNQAVALARLGAEVTFIGAVGADAYGREFLEALDAESIDASRMVVLGDDSTSVAVPMVTPDGDVAFVHAPGANAKLTPAAVRDLPDCDVLLLQGEIPVETSIAAAATAGRQGALVTLNPAPAHGVSPELVAAAAILTPNEVEARELAQAATADAVTVARNLAAGRRGAAITLGARGAAWSFGDDSGLATPPSIVAIDATGAGDSFCAALAIALVEGQTPANAVRFACAAGAAAATVRGAEPGLPTRAVVQALLEG